MPAVKLRKRKISGNRYALLTDTYPSPGGKRFSSLRLYISAKPKTIEEKEVNKQILATAAQICQRKTNELSKPEVYSRYELEALKRQEKGQYSFAEFCRQQIAKVDNGGYRAYKTALHYFLQHIGQNDIKCTDINQLIVDEFREYLFTAPMIRRKGTISQNSMATYMGAMKGLLSDAFKAGYLLEDYGRNVLGISGTDSKRQWPSIQEMEQLWQTPCECPLLKEMSLFSALTGLRFSDCYKLERSEIKLTNAGYHLDFSQKKTGSEALLPISSEAASLIPPIGEKPFECVDYNRMQRPLRRWFADAGITNHLTFHSFRHFYATALLNSGINLVTVQKMLGQKSIKSTQVYAHVLEEKKMIAANTIKLNLVAF